MRRPLDHSLAWTRLAWPVMHADAPRLPLAMNIMPAAGKGFGAFAAEAAREGDWICRYEGELLTLDETMQRYLVEDPAYLYSHGDGSGFYLDGERGTHASRYINHHQNGTLVPKVEMRTSVDFYAARDISLGDELTFDYGVSYWLGSRGAPTADSDARTFELCKERDWRGAGPGWGGRPPIVATELAELREVEAMDDAAEARAAMLRTLEFFGATRLSSGGLSVPTTLREVGCELGEGAHEVLSPDAPLTALRGACARLLEERERERQPARNSARESGMSCGR